MTSVLSVIATTVALILPVYRGGIAKSVSGPDVAPCGEVSGLGRWYPAEIASNKVFVRGHINNSKPLRFVIDTGAPSGFIDDTRIESLGFRRQQKGSGTGSAGSSSVTLTRLEPPGCQAVAGASIPDEMFGALRLDEISTVEGLRVDGLVGGDFFNRFVVEIDYAHHRIRMLPASFDYRGPGISVPISTENGYIYTMAVATTNSGTTVEGKFMIDTGFRTAVSFTAPFATQHQLTDASPMVRDTVMGIGAGGQSRATIFRLSSLQVAGLRWREVVATASLDRGGLLARSDLAGVIGGDLLRRYHVFLDYPHRRLILERTASSDLPFEYDESGLFLVADSPAFRTIRVLLVLPGSPAAEAGVSENDVIDSIDGRLTSTIGLDGVRRLFLKHNVRYKLIIKRNRAAMPLAFRTRSLFKAPTPSGTVKHLAAPVIVSAP
jgi:aspartyl protease/PDZ domain-containing protein